MKILLVEDNREIRNSIVTVLELEGINVLTAENGLAAQRILANETVTLIVTDLKMPGMDGLSLLKWLQHEGPSTPVVMMSAYGEISDAVEAMKLGAEDYLVKPFDIQEFLIRVKRVIEKHELQERVESGWRKSANGIQWIGESLQMRQIKRLVEKIALTSSTALITGPSGVGKEVIARMIHASSPRSSRLFVAINLAGIPEHLVESELFGYEKGAFTGAYARKIGICELANEGVLLLDEIGDMPFHLQGKLLRVLQERKIQRLGGTQSIPIDVRIIAATNRDLEELVQQHTFREDLFYRLNVIRIEIPPLHERAEDIPVLTGYFIKQFNKQFGKTVKGIRPDALELLQSYNFPGNVRELENLIERAMILAESDVLTSKDLNLPELRVNSLPRKGTLDDVQREAIIEALQRWEGNKTQAAKELGIDRKTLLRKLTDYGVKGI
ncbi:two component, sigma54 specific, transcriptional regulator, Fis family [Candidatus Vecturithrix granuli]|uniref:Two component, sigma54 specific, transcriptional regulator, Fis family n=1 Tax=Vecturithrix granuli TaxID=1499967 RepID=A0A081C4H8_VECG1|nr:two component, sigma54 specific, transcriptional regulator, Fis family [Candidatus Vecturithrix granuli]